MKKLNRTYKRLSLLSLNPSQARIGAISSKRPRRGRISITAGEESEANGTCGFTARKQNVLEEGEHKQNVNIPLMFALFEDDLTIIL